ncbi:GTPase IMAP family member 8 [Brachyhypopomus gauderio]|uniref:GTPase IMAP family member 8 n=1 Tax=Brachyhypopomus gauderio TaxID=698409 RepID=UPI004043008C
MELRVVLFGGKMAGKSSVINTVFGKNLQETDRRTAQSKKFQGNVYGREVTLVDTPGWWKPFSLSDTADFLKQELVHGVSLCEPGPHAVLLVIEIDNPFIEKHRKAMEDHLGLLGAQIWTYALVLFTRCSTLGNRTVQEHIENEEALQWIVEKCRHTYHVLDNTISDDISQVQLLLEKIERMIQRNNGTLFEIDSKILQESKEWRKNVIFRATERKMRVQEQQKSINKEELRIILLGWVTSGKSSSGNTILNKREFITGKRTVKCQRGCGEVCGRPVTVLDTPSWWKYIPSQYTPEWIKSEIIDGLCQKANSPHVILLVIPADTSFKEKQREVIEENMKILGEHVWKYTIILFTWGDILGDVTIEQHIESEGEALMSLVEKCENRYHVFDNKKREDCTQVTELLQKIDVMVVRAALRRGLYNLCAETNSEIKASNENSDMASRRSDEEYDQENVVRLVDEEWRRRDEAFLKQVLRMYKDHICANIKGSSSMHVETNFSRSRSATEAEDIDATEVGTRDQESGTNPDTDGEDKHTLRLKDHVKEMLHREWSRREDALMGRLKNMLSELSLETSSDPTQDDLERSNRKVLHWLETQSWYSVPSDYASGSDCSNQMDTSIPPEKKTHH